MRFNYVHCPFLTNHKLKHIFLFMLKFCSTKLMHSLFFLLLYIKYRQANSHFTNSMFFFSSIYSSISLKYTNMEALTKVNTRIAFTYVLQNQNVGLQNTHLSIMDRPAYVCEIEIRFSFCSKYGWCWVNGQGYLCERCEKKKVNCPRAFRLIKSSEV